MIYFFFSEQSTSMNYFVRMYVMYVCLTILSVCINDTFFNTMIYYTTGAPRPL